MIQEFQQAMQDIGLTIDTPITKGKIQRVPVAGIKVLHGHISGLALVEART